MARRTANGVLLAALGMLLAGSLAFAAPAGAAELSITPTPSTGLTDAQTISVQGNAGQKNAPKLYVAVCETTPTASNCDQDLADVGTPTAHILQVSPDPETGAWGPVDFYLRQNIVTGDSPDGFDCLTNATCVIGTTNSADPKDRTFNVTALLGFGTTSSAPATPASNPVATEDDDSSPLVPIGIAVVVVVVVAGVIAVAVKRRSGGAPRSGHELGS
jgi:hypothetical protein